MKKVACWEKLRERNYYISGIDPSIFCAGMREDNLVGGLRVVLAICRLDIFQGEM